MSTPVLPYVPSMGLRHALARQFLSNALKDGYIRITTPETARSRANGNEGISSYKGLNRFTFGFPNTLKGSGNLADLLWDFFITRLDNLNEPFYIYNPTEYDPPDETGTVTTGRYYVRLANPNQVLNRDYFRSCLFNYNLELIECVDFSEVICMYDDDFDGDNGDPPDSNLWDVDITGTPDQFEIYNNQLRYWEDGGGNTNTVKVTSKYFLDGSQDFDIRLTVDYSFLDYTTDFTYKYVYLRVVNDDESIWSGIGFNAESYTHVAKGAGSQGSSTGYAILGSGTLVDTTFRIVQTSGVVKVYMWFNGQWEWAGNTNGRTMNESYAGEDVYTQIWIQHTTEETQLHFTNFSIKEGCPAI